GAGGSGRGVVGVVVGAGDAAVAGRGQVRGRRGCRRGGVDGDTERAGGRRDVARRVGGGRGDAAVAAGQGAGGDGVGAAGGRAAADLGRPVEDRDRAAGLGGACEGRRGIVGDVVRVGAAGIAGVRQVR